MKLIVGLGNPGRHYVNNRHNVGFQCVDYIARRHGIALSSRRARSRLGTGEIGGTQVVLAKPATFMNLSGEAVAALMGRYRLTAAKLLVIYDDLDLPLGQVRIRARGSSGGHNGMKSIIAHLGSQDFARLRVGIAPPESGTDVGGKAADTANAVDYVLGDFTAEEKAVVREVYPEVADAVECMITQSITAAMNRYN
jgi:PTH1 family peptidyl-tRNA hydrolase